MYKKTDTIETKKREIRGMFDSIVPAYDFLNSFLSFGIDRMWRKRVILEAGPLEGRSALDLCCGTGSLTELLVSSGAETVALDFSFEMLKKGYRAGRVGKMPVAADASFMPFKDNLFHAQTIAFGIRNIPDAEKFISESYRTLKPGGRLIILELTRPANPFAGILYFFYLNWILPIAGGLLSGRMKAYRYLAKSISAFTDPSVLKGMISAAGFPRVKIIPLTFGVATIIVCEK